MPKGNLGEARESMKLIVVAHKGSRGNVFVCVPGGGGGGGGAESATAPMLIKWSKLCRLSTKLDLARCCNVHVVWHVCFDNIILYSIWSSCICCGYFHLDPNTVHSSAPTCGLLCLPLSRNKQYQVSCC